MRLAIVGSRNYEQLAFIRQLVDLLSPGVIVVSGGGGLADKEAEDHAIKRGLKTDIYPADWAKYGLPAGPKRNTLIVENCDALVAFLMIGKKNTGTMDSIRKAIDRNIPVFMPERADQIERIASIVNGM